MENEIIPFLKWAGGKRWLVKKYSEYFPNQYNVYIEPFLGSGATFFYLKPEKAFLNDKNMELINAYSAIKSDWWKVYSELLIHQRNHSKNYYYAIRNRTYRSEFKRAARFIYLNRTCWNGLYRVNLKGFFNVPIGTKNKVILDTDNFEETSKLLSRVDLMHGDFELALSKAREDDFIFVDPPYTVKHNNNGFIKYNESLFTWNDQLRLAQSLKKVIKMGVKVVLTNADHESIKRLYKKEFEIITVERNSIIAAASKFRTKSNELIIRSKNV